MEEAPGRVVFEVPCPEVALGPHRFDIRHRPVLVGILSGPLVSDPTSLLARAHQLVADGADALEVAVGPGLLDLVDRLHDEVHLPLCVVTEGADVLERVLAAGAVAALDPSGFADPGYLDVAATAGASVIVRPARGGDPDVDAVARCLRAGAERAEAAGIGHPQVVIDGGVDLVSGAPALRLLRGHRRLTDLGWPLSLSVDAAADDPAESTAAVALGTALGARLLRVRDVRAARRAADVVAAIVRARTEVPA